MRAKKAKKLRKVAQAMTVGKPQVKYRTVPGSETLFFNGRVELDTKCTRSVYQRLKAHCNEISV
jgi:hypothetical protein